ncbi:MAG: helix-turn-helix transcriptional regulator [Candidatus Reddybacter sp.]
MEKKILRLPDVMSSTGLSRSTVYSKISDGTFPNQVSLGDRSVGWIDSEIYAWINQRIEASRDAVIKNTQEQS